MIWDFQLPWGISHTSYGVLCPRACAPRNAMRSSGSARWWSPFVRAVASGMSSTSEQARCGRIQPPFEAVPICLLFFIQNNPVAKGADVTLTFAAHCHTGVPCDHASLCLRLAGDGRGGQPYGPQHSNAAHGPHRPGRGASRPETGGAGHRYRRGIPRRFVPLVPPAQAKAMQRLASACRPAFLLFLRQQPRQGVHH